MRFLAAALLVAIPTAALATPPCRCPGELPPPPTMFPIGADPIPRNTAPFLFLRHDDVGSVQLAPFTEETGSGPPVTTTVDAPDPAVAGFWVRPGEPLAASTTYRLTVQLRDGTTQSFELRTGDALDEAPPTLEGATLTNGLAELCDRHIGATLQVDAAGELPLLVRLRLGGATYHFRRGGDLDAMEIGRVLEPDHCAASPTGAERPGTFVGTVELFDAAGQASASREVSVTLEPRPGVDFGFGCASVGWLPWLFLGARLRRRRASRDLLP